MKEHTVRSFEQALQTVTDDILRMGRLASAQLTAAIALLAGAETDEAPAIQAADDLVDDLDEKIEREVQRILALRQPMAADLRGLISCDRIATDLERIADHAKNIAKRAASVAALGAPVDFTLTRQLAELVSGQLEAMIAAIERGDVAAAEAIWLQDEEVDACYEKTFNAQLEGMCRGPGTAASCTHALFIVKSLERIGDHVTNIAEDLVYWITGARQNKRNTGDQP